MQTIETKYHGATNTKSARIIAKTSGGASLSIPYPYGLSDNDCHAKAAMALAAKLGWSGDMICGGTKSGCVFVFANGPEHLRYTIGQSFSE